MEDLNEEEKNATIEHILELADYYDKMDALQERRLKKLGEDLDREFAKHRANKHRNDTH